MSTPTTAARAAAEWWAQQVGAPTHRLVDESQRTFATDFAELSALVASHENPIPEGGAASFAVVSQLAIEPPRYDVSPDFPSDPAGWGEPGSIRHAENIGHGVWMAEHPDDDLSSDELIARSQAAREDLAGAMAATRNARFGEVEPTRCPIPGCDRLDHPVFEMCEDAVGHTWFQGETPRHDRSN